MVKKNLIQDYLDLQSKYILKYGDNTLVLMEVGSFYECYAVEEKELDTLKVACNLMGIRITRKNNKILDNEISVSNPYMAGVTSIAFNKYMKILLNNNYTIVKIDQVTPPPNPKREVTRIYSPGTFWDSDNSNDNCTLMSIYIEGLPQENDNILYSIGISIIDLSTGECRMIELYDQLTNNPRLGVISETYRLIYNYQPVEIIFTHKNASSLSREFFNKVAYNTEKFHNLGELDSKYENIPYQNNFLKKYFSCVSTVSIVDYIGLTKYNYCLISYLLLLDFAYEHETLLVTLLPKPIIISDNNLLNISYQSIEVLDILNNNKKSKSLYKLLNLCNTSPGKREFKNKLLHPISNVKELNNRYNKIKCLLPYYKEFEYNLKNTYDIHRLHRKLLINNNVKPYEFNMIHTTYDILINILKNLESKNLKDTFILKEEQNILERFNEYRESYNSVLNVSILNKFNSFSDINQNIFKDGVYLDIDKLYIEKQKNIDILDNFKNKLSILTFTKKDNIHNFFNNEQYYNYDASIKSKIIKEYENIDIFYNNIKTDYNDKDGYFLKITKSKFKDFKRNILFTNHLKYFYTEKDLDNLDRLKFKEKTNEVVIQSSYISEVSNNILRLDLLIKDKSRQLFLENIKNWLTKYNEIINWTNHFISNFDIFVAGAKMADVFNYCQPIIDKNKKTSGIQAKELRHPILERLNQNSIYVTNDIDIGSFSNKNGMLITGLNGVGKSIYIKSIALCIILAQSGFFVPSYSFYYYPYNNLFTRIGNNDNLFKGQSTFYCEMLELDEILRNCNENTLVIADELCSGSEQYSAQSILATTILELSDKNTNYLLTTHFHQSLSLPEIENLNCLEFYHFSIEYDKENQSIIYNRKLKKGVGETLYGIEVCRNIIQNKRFINKCFDFRNKLLESNKNNADTNIDIKVSNYNNSLIVEKCEICGLKNTREGLLHTHHINEQYKACEENNYIDHFHKNDLGNLVILCNKHHNDVHHGSLIIKGWKETLDKGRLLDFYYDDKVKISRKKYKYSKSDVDKILNIKIQVGNKTKMAKYILEKDYGFNKISEITIKKIWNNNYFKDS